MTNTVHISRDDTLDGAAERRAIPAYRQDGIERCLHEPLSGLGWENADIATVTRSGAVRTGYGRTPDH